MRNYAGWALVGGAGTLLARWGASEAPRAAAASRSGLWRWLGAFMLPSVASTYAIVPVRAEVRLAGAAYAAVAALLVVRAVATAPRLRKDE